jgi:hypothetical protein
VWRLRSRHPPPGLVPSEVDRLDQVPQRRLSLGHSPVREVPGGVEVSLPKKLGLWLTVSRPGRVESLPAFGVRAGEHLLGRVALIVDIPRRFDRKMAM